MIDSKFQDLNDICGQLDKQLEKIKEVVNGKYQKEHMGTRGLKGDFAVINMRNAIRSMMLMPEKTEQSILEAIDTKDELTPQEVFAYAINIFACRVYLTALNDVDSVLDSSTLLQRIEKEMNNEETEEKKQQKIPRKKDSFGKKR